MGSLGDAFPEEIRKKFAEDKIEPGAVIKCKVDGIDHPKMFILVGEDEENLAFASVYINTNINPNIFRSEYMKSLHYALIKEKGNDFLDYDSNVDCSRLKFWPKSDLVKIVSSDSTSYFGKIPKSDFISITQKIAAARTIPPIEKKKIGFA